MASTVKDAILRGRKTIEGVVEGGLNTVETVVEAGLNTVDTVVDKGRQTVESAVSLGRRTVEHTLLHGHSTMRAAVLHGREDIRIEQVPVPGGRAGRIDRPGGRRADLRNRPEGLSPRLSCAHDRAAGACLATNWRERLSRRARESRISRPATVWWRSTPRPAASATSARAARRISATICSSITAPMPSSFAFRPASWPRTRSMSRTTCRWNTRR